MKKSRHHWTTTLFLSTVFFVVLSLGFLSWAQMYGDETSGMTVEQSDSAPMPESMPDVDKKAVEVAAPAVSQREELEMLRGDLETIKVRSLTRVSVSNPDVADFSSVESDRVIVLAKKAGQTEIFLWDEQGKRTIFVRVFEEDLNSLKSRLEQFLKIAGMEGVSFMVSAYEGKLIAMGELPKEKKAEFTKIIAPFTNNVRDLVKEELNEDLVQIDVQLAQLSTDYTKKLGLQWPESLTYNEIDFSASVPRDIFKVSPLSRATQISATINALISEGKGRILSKPKLVVKSGKEASFLVGGQIPITTTTTTAGGNVQQNVEFKDYGISLTITPTIKNNRVDVVMRVNVSDPDTTASLKNSQSVAFTTTTAQTQLFLDNKQTVVLAGLIKHNESQTVTKVPFLGDIPLVGLAFRNKVGGPNKDVELVITLTPTIIRQKVPEKAVKASEKETPKEVEAELESTPEEKEETAAPPTTDELIAEYMKSIQEKISQSINYPFEAKEKDQTGVVKLGLRILKDGSLADVSIKESSGYDIFDKDAVNTAHISAPYDPFPEGLDLEELLVTAPIVYGPESLLKTRHSRPEAEEVYEPKEAPAPQEVPQPSNSAERSFAEAVQERIAQAIEYPDEAREYGWEGTVKLSLLIFSDGSLADVLVKESSGHDVLDEAAVKTAKELAPYSDFPSESDLQELNITVPIVFSLQQE